MSTTNKNKFSIINSYFDHVYILSIERAKERHEKLKQNLFGLDYTLFFGIDKAEINLISLIEQKIYDPIKAIQISRYSKPMKAGEIACSMGHKAIYENMLINKYNKVLILEDDVIVNDEGLLQFNQITSQIPKNWDILYFDYFKNENKNKLSYLKQTIYHLQKKIGFLKLSHKTISNLFATKYSKNLKRAGYHDYTSAYGISLVTAKKLIELQSPIVFPSDHALSYSISNELLIGFIIIPKVFIQQSQTTKSEFGSYVEN